MNHFCTIYLARHGETEWNLKRLLQGHTDSPLTRQGVRQAKSLAKSLRRVNFSAIYSSDSGRAYRTASFVALNQQLTVVATKLLRERYFGRYEGKPWRYFQTQLDRLLQSRQELVNPPDRNPLVDPTIESEDALTSRLILFLRQTSLNHLNQNILIVSHGGSIRTILLHLGYITTDQLSSLLIDNTAYVVIRSDGTEFEVTHTHGLSFKPA